MNRPETQTNSHEKCTVIISVYRDVDNLSCILQALSWQTYPANEIIISEDGEDPKMASFVQQAVKLYPNIKHLTQADKGFRKNRALNRAILAACNEILIFIDGDCVPHRRFIESHVSNIQPGYITVGRRAEIGPFFSRLIKYKKWARILIQNRLAYLLLLIPMTIDKGKNIESGFYSQLLQKLNENKKPGLLGCNFAIYKQNLLEINGFDEQYELPGIGEDSDIEWRLLQSGVKKTNVKFISIEYHLYHSTKYSQSNVNLKKFESVKKARIISCSSGINNHT